MLNIITLQGRLVREPEIKLTTSGVKLCRFTIACQRNRKEKDGSKTSDFIDCTAWSHTADFVEKYFHKGDMCIIDGSLETNTYQNGDGKNVKSYSVFVNGVNFAGALQTSKSEIAPAGVEDGGLPFEV